MNNFCISIFLASILLLTSCGDGGPTPGSGSGDCSVTVPSGRSYNIVLQDGTTLSGTAPEGGITVNFPCPVALVL